MFSLSTASVFATFSIAARCASTNQLGVATSTAALAGGAFVPHARPELAAVATQSFTNPYLASRAFELISQGFTPIQVLDHLQELDTGRALRQVALVDGQGRSAAFTGARCEQWAGHLTEANVAVAGNTLASKQVVIAMLEAFRANQQEKLAERLVQALEAGQAAGGDRRGRQSAALIVAWKEDYCYVDLRVDDHPEPVAELRRLWQIYQAELEPYMPLFPSKERLAGETDINVWLNLAHRDS
jgi:uncharacterized Ntn-hydrolase superfamily protein